MAYNSYQYPLRLAVKAQIQALLAANALPGLTTATTVLSRAAPLFHDFGLPGSGKTYTWPGIIVSNAQAESDTPITNRSQERSYYINVVIADQFTDPNMATILEDADEDNRLAWRDILIDNLAPQGITIASPAVQFYLSEYVGGQVVDWNQITKDKRWVSSMVFRYRCRRAHV